MNRLTAGWERLTRRDAQPGVGLLEHWRSSMQLRVVVTSLVAGIISVGALGGYLTTTIRDGVFEQRVEEILIESARSTEQAQITFDATTASTTAQVQQLLNDLLPKLRTSGTSSREVFLWRPENSTTVPSIIDLTTAPALRGLITPEMRAEVLRDDYQMWQSAAIPDDAQEHPGIVVGALVEVPLAGPFELYYAYSLEAEAQTMAFLQRILLAGAAVLVAVLAGITWITTRQVVRPVRKAARSAHRLAAGNLDERLRVRGRDEIATLGRSFNAMAESLQRQIVQMEDLSTLQRRFVSDVSHELRTPLTTIRMAGEIINDSREGFDPPVRRSAELLNQQLDRFEDLLGDLLEISRFDAGAATLDAERRDIRDVVDRAVDNAVVLAHSKGVFLSVQHCQDPAIADIDPRRVERIVRNLLVNAIEHAEDGPVEVTVGATSQAVAVVVRDFGVGMAPDAAAHVFDRFWRADPARARTTGGTGLGLAISLEDAHLHGGWLEAWGRPGEGASFRLTVPARAGMKLANSPLLLVPDSTDPREEGLRDFNPNGPEHRFGPSAIPNMPVARTQEDR